jgi:hypothetical protein
VNQTLVIKIEGTNCDFFLSYIQQLYLPFKRDLQNQCGLSTVAVHGSTGAGTYYVNQSPDNFFSKIQPMAQIVMMC